MSDSTKEDAGGGATAAPLRPCGLVNPGCITDVNAAVQILYFMRAFREATIRVRWMEARKLPCIVALCDGSCVAGEWGYWIRR